MCVGVCVSVCVYSDCMPLQIDIMFTVCLLYMQVHITCISVCFFSSYLNMATSFSNKKKVILTAGWISCLMDIEFNHSPYFLLICLVYSEYAVSKHWRVLYSKGLALLLHFHFLCFVFIYFSLLHHCYYCLLTVLLNINSCC